MSVVQRRELKVEYVPNSQYRDMRPGQFFVLSQGVIMKCPWCGLPHKIGSKDDSYNRVKVEWFMLTLEKTFQCVECRFRCDIKENKIKVLSNYGN